MAPKLRRGFKAEAERIAARIRSELKLAPTEPLLPETLARHLGIRVVPLTELTSYGFPEHRLRHLVGDGVEDFSAMTVLQGGRRLIVYNQAHSPGRRSSSLAHELAHILLEHEPVTQPLVDGCRRWSASIEEEADWLAGVLLVPRAAALSVVRAGTPLHVAAEAYGVSVAMMRWRINSTGVMKQVIRGRNRRR